MDWSSFVSDLIAGVLGTMVGIVVGLRIDHRQERAKAELRDLQLLQGLVDRLAGKRAFSAERTLVGEIDPEDRERCTRSVLDARQRIASVSERIATQAEPVSILQGMESDCIAYLNFVESLPDRCVEALAGLAGQLAVREEALKGLVPDLRLARPGSRDAANPPWLPT